MEGPVKPFRSPGSHGNMTENMRLLDFNVGPIRGRLSAGSFIVLGIPDMEFLRTLDVGSGIRVEIWGANTYDRVESYVISRVPQASGLGFPDDHVVELLEAP